jgi:DAACS family dicarboxylate/amino acid:cation (Na+ or H+) symporter
MGIVIGVDRLLDMCRTTVNVWGDMGAARVMTRLAPDE